MRFKAVILWTIVSGGSLVIGCGLVGALGQSSLGAVLPYTPFFGLVLLIIFALISGGPIAVILTGLGKRKWEMVAGGVVSLVIAMAGSATYEAVSDRLETQRLTRSVAELDVRTFALPVARHATVVMENSGRADCDQLCQLILVNSDYDVVVRGPSADGILYREISHAQCIETWYVRHNLQFFGICVTTEGAHWIDDGLFIETPMTLPGRNVFPTALDYRFHGMAYALVERQQGEERVLGRWVAGKVKVGWFESDQIGQDFTREAFYRAALGMRLEIEDLRNATWMWEAR